MQGSRDISFCDSIGKTQVTYINSRYAKSIDQRSDLRFPIIPVILFRRRRNLSIVSRHYLHIPTTAPCPYAVHARRTSDILAPLPEYFQPTILLPLAFLIRIAM